MSEGLWNVTGISRGQLPFSYLGVNISPKRLSVNDCSGLIDKISSRIRGIGFRKLSYAGRVVLIRSVLSSLHCYWARIFILPKMVIQRIEAICRRFMWNGTEYGGRLALVAWEKICRPRKCGVLELHDFQCWYLAAIAKFVWWIGDLKESLWFQWVHSFHLKQRE